LTRFRSVDDEEERRTVTTDPEHLTAVEEFAELRRCLDVGLARIDGQLALLARVTALEQARWPLPAVSAFTAVGALAVAVWQALGR
jgi:ferric-dicitrate binding protein FerR (iron transport regulator)